MHICIILHKLNKVIVNYYPLLVKKFMSSINNLFNIYHDTVIVLSVELWLMIISYEINIRQRCNDIVKLRWITFVFFVHKSKKKYHYHSIIITCNTLFCITSFSTSLFDIQELKRISFEIYLKNITPISIHFFPIASNWYRRRTH